MAAAASFIEIKPHLPVFSIEGDDFTDAATVDRDGNSANIQVVSTSCDPRLVVSKESITELVIDRINSKHKKDQAYSAGSFLVVFVTQSDWTLDMRRVRESVSSNPLFCSYWVISPVNPASGCRFLVDNFWNTESGADESVQLVVDFTPPDTEVYINSLSDFTKYGRMYSLEAYLHK